MSAPHPNRDALLAEALAAKARGWLLTPLDGKKPIQRSWQRQPPPTEESICKWVAEGRNLGLRTGAVSGVIVIDDDTEDGSGAKTLGLPPTVTVVTGSGKRHYYFMAPHAPIGNSASKLSEHVDVRGDGGQVVFVGSIHPKTGQPYRWLEGHSPDEIEMAELPAHIVETLCAKATENASAKGSAVPARTRQVPPAPRIYRYVQAVLRRSRANVASASEGERNETLNKAAFSLGKFVGAGLLDRFVAEEALLEDAISVGLSADEAQATIASGLDAGAANPIDRDELIKKTQLPRGARRPAPKVPQPDSTGAPQSVRSTHPEVGIQRARKQIEFRNLGNDTPLHQLVPAALSALAERCLSSIYVQGGRLARVTKENTAESQGVRRAAGLRIRSVPEAVLREQLDFAAAWMETRENKNGDVDVIEKWAPRAVVAAVAEHGEYPGLHPLIGVVEGPTLRPDGSVLDRPGYDASTALMYQPARDYPGVPEHPTPEDVRRAWDEVLNPFMEFPFETPSDHASLAAFMLTIAGRPAIDGPVPHWAVLAHTFGAGKTLLVEAAAIAMTGVEPDSMAPVGGRSADAESEMRKRLTTLVLDAPRVAMIDNFPDGGTFESKAFAALLTADRWTDRLLGKSEKISLPHRVVWVTTGCNFRLWGDLARRSLSILIDPRVESPHLRSFKIEDLGAHVRQEHARLLVAALTILRGFIVAGKPRHAGALLGKFEAWDRLIRSAVIWASGLCGEVLDPLDTAGRMQDEAPDRSGLRELMSAWSEGFVPGAPVTAREVVEACKVAPQLREAVVGIGGAKNGEPDGRALGNRLRVLAGRVLAGQAFQAAGDCQGVTKWRLMPVEPAGGGTRGSGGSCDDGGSSPRAPARVRENSDGAPTRPTGSTSPTDVPASEREVALGDAIDERAAIIEHDAGLPRAEAEQRAWASVLGEEAAP